MKYVYFLQSVEHPEQNDVGFADDLKARFKVHNSGGLRGVLGRRESRCV